MTSQYLEYIQELADKIKTAIREGDITDIDALGDALGDAICEASAASPWVSDDVLVEEIEDDLVDAMGKVAWENDAFDLEAAKGCFSVDLGSLLLTCDYPTADVPVSLLLTEISIYHNDTRGWWTDVPTDIGFSGDVITDEIVLSLYRLAVQGEEPWP